MTLGTPECKSGQYGTLDHALPEGQGLYRRLITYECEEFSYDPDVERPVLEIVGDDRMAVRGMRLALDELGVFVMNELRLTQGYGVSANEMVALGFRGGADRARATIQHLASVINQPNAQPYIEQHIATDGDLEAILMPEVQVVDRRKETAQPVFTGEVVDDGIVRDEAGNIIIRETGGIYFMAPRYRAAVTLAMLRDFGQWADKDARLMDILDGRLGSRAHSPVLPIQFLHKLTREQEDILLAEKEQAMLQYLQLDGFPSKTQLETIVDGINAYYELFAHNLDLVHLMAWSNTRRVPYADLYQESAAQVLNAVLHIGLNYERSVSFRVIAYNNIRRRGKQGTIPLYYDSLFPPGTFPYSQVPQLGRFRQKIDEIMATERPLPSLSTLCKRLNMGRDTVLGLLSIGRQIVYLDDADKAKAEVEGQAVLESADFADELVDQQNNAAMIEAVFDAVPLSTDQKVILSICYGVFIEGLVDQNIYRQGKTVFTYPKTLEAFEALCQQYPNLTQVGVGIFGSHHEHARKLHDRALIAVRTFLREHAAFDTADRIDANEAERQELVAAALRRSPDQRLSTQDIRQAVADGDLASGEERICKLFGSIPAFQQACGFEPDRGQAYSRNLSDEEIIAMAKELQPDAPLRTGQIRAFSKDKRFVSLQLILGRWKSLPAFHQACGF